MKRLALLFPIFSLIAMDGAYLLVEDGLLPLHQATAVGDLATCERLVAEGVDVGSSYRGMTVLHFAAKNGHLDFVRILLDKGGDRSGR